MILDRALQWVASRLKAYLPGPGGLGFTEGAWSLVHYDYETLGSAFCYNPWVYAAVTRISEVTSAIPLKLYRETRRGPDVEREEVFEHPFLDLLWNPGRFSGGTEGLIAKTAADYMLNGEFWWYLENGSGGENVFPADLKEIRVFKAQHMDIVPDAADLIRAYRFSKSGSIKDFDPEFFVHGKRYNPKDDFRGLPPLEVAKTPVLLQYYVNRYNQMMFANGADPGTIMATDKSMGPDEVKRLSGFWNKMHQGVENAHKMGWLTHGFKPQKIGTSNKDAMLDLIMKMSLQEVLAIYNIPLVMVGLTESVNYANAREQVRVFFKYTITPICRAIQGAINTQLLPTWYGADKGLYVEFDLSDVEALQEDALKRAQVDQIYVNAGIKAINEVRLDLQLEPFDDDEFDLPRAPGGTGGFGGLLSDKGPSHPRAVIPPTRADQWKARDRDYLIAEQKINGAVTRFFVAQSERVLRYLDAAGLLAGVAPIAPSKAALRVSSVRQVDPDELFGIFDLDAENREIIEAVMPVIRNITEQVGNSALESVGGVAEFKITDPRVLKFLAEKEILIKDINNTTAKILREILIDASAEGVSVAETGRRIRTQFEDFSKSRALTIARTESVSVNSSASLEGFRQSEVVKKKEWLSSRDGNVRESHVAADGQVVLLDDAFDVGGMPMPAPGVGGPAEEVINCRCAVLPVLED